MCKHFPTLPTKHCGKSWFGFVGALSLCQWFFFSAVVVGCEKPVLMLILQLKLQSFCTIICNCCLPVAVEIQLLRVERRKHKESEKNVRL